MTGLFQLRRRLPIPLLAVLAAANLAAAVVRSGKTADRSQDVWIFRAWIQDMLAGVDVSSIPVGQIEHAVDYPPWALVTFLPLGFLPASWVVLASALTTVVVMPALAFAAARVMAPRVPRADLLVPALLVLCWGASIRTIVPFTPIPILLGLLAVARGAHPWQAGVSLGLALAKPHIALPFLIWTAGRKEYRTIAIAAAVVGLELAAYCAMTSANPLAVTVQWLRTLAELYAVSTKFVGITGLRGLLDDGLPTRVVDVLVPVFAAATVAVMWRLRSTSWLRSSTAGAPLVIPLGSLFVTLSFYHYRQDLVLLVPVFMTVYFWREASRSARVAMLCLMQAVLMSDVRQRPWLVPLEGWPIPLLLEHSYRLVAFSSLAYIAVVARLDRARTASAGAPDLTASAEVATT